jgi:hypothetical protein
VFGRTRSLQCFDIKLEFGPLGFASTEQVRGRCSNDTLSESIVEATMPQMLLSDVT